MSAFTTRINITWDGCCCCCCLVAQLCSTLCYPIDCSPPGSSVHGRSQSRRQLQLIRQKESRVWVRNLWKVRADINTWENFACVLSCFSRVQLCDPMDHSPPGSSVCGILQAWILEWVAMPFSRWSSQFWHWTHVSYISFTGRQVLYH